MAKKQKQPKKTCSDCIHESACRIWTDGRYISGESASKCPNHETVKESSAYLCGVLDERKRKSTNADRIRAMSDEGIAKYFAAILVEQRVLDAAANGKNISYVSRRVLEAAFYSMLLQQLKQPVNKEETK